LTEPNSNCFVPKQRYPRGGLSYSDIHDQEVLNSLSFRIGPERRRKAGMPTGVYYWIHPTREYSTHFGNVRCQSHWMGKSPIPKTDYVMYFIRWVTGGHFTRGFYCINLPLCDSCWSI